MSSKTEPPAAAAREAAYSGALSAREPVTPPGAGRPDASWLLRTALWFGIVAGLVEGTLFIVIEATGRVLSVSPAILWISAAFDTVLFGLAGLCLLALSRLAPRLPIRLLAIFALALLAWLSWVGLTLEPYVHRAAIVLLAAGLAVQSTRWIRRRQPALDRVVAGSFRWIVIAVAAGAILSAAGARLRERMQLAALPPAAPGAPNVLIILLDALRADHLSSYGYSRPTSPNIDRIASEGVLFRRAVSTASYTLASHASILSGLYPNRHHAEWTTPQMYAQCDCLSLATFLRENGYRTAAFSANLFWFTRDYGFDRGFIRFGDYFHNPGDMVLRTVYGRIIEHLVLPRLGIIDIPARKRADDINRAALDWIGEQQGHPFFVFLNYFDVHDPYLPPQPFRSRFSDRPEPGGLVNWRIGGLDPQLTPEERQSEIDAYDGSIAYVDHYVGLLMQALEERGLADNTLVIITADHGEEFDEHGMYLHGQSLYREVIHVPLIFWYGDRLPAGTAVDQPVSNASIAATIVDLIGARSPNPFAGSLAPEVTGRPRSEPLAFPLAELVKKPWGLERAPSFQGAIKSLVSPQWHYIEHETMGPALYDWEADPREEHNLADRPELRAVVDSFRRELRTPRGTP